MRRLPLTRLIENACFITGWTESDSTEPGVVTLAYGGDENAEHVESAIRRATKRRNVTDALLREAVDHYHRHGGNVEDAARSFGASRSQMYRYLQRARERGLPEAES